MERVLLANGSCLVLLVLGTGCPRDGLGLEVPATALERHFLRLGSLLGLQVGAFPDEAGLAGGIAVEEFAGGGAADVPLLGLFTEADVRGSEDLEPSERTEVNRFGVEAVDAAAGVEAEGLAHGLL